MAVKKQRKKKWRFRGEVEEFRTTSVSNQPAVLFIWHSRKIIFPSYNSSQCKNGTAHYFPTCVLDLSSMCKDEKLILTQANHHVICIANMILQLWRCARRLNWDFSVVFIHGSTMMCFVFRVFLHRRLKNDKAQFICFYCMLQYIAIVSSISYQTLWANTKETLIYELQLNIQMSLYFVIAGFLFFIALEQYLLNHCVKHVRP